MGRSWSTADRRPSVAVIALNTLFPGSAAGFEQYSAFDYQRCETHRDSSVVAVYVYVALSTYLPGTLIFVSNVMLLLRLRRSDSLRRSLFGKSRTKQRKCIVKLAELMSLSQNSGEMGQGVNVAVWGHRQAR